MEGEQILTYIGMCVVVLFAIYYIYSVMKVQNNVIEGLKNNSNNTPLSTVLETLKKNNELLSDEVLVKKYKTEYEDLVIEYEKFLNFNILQWLKMNASKQVDTKTYESYSQLNEMYKFKEHLNSTMEFIDENA